MEFLPDLFIHAKREIRGKRAVRIKIHINHLLEHAVDLLGIQFKPTFHRMAI